MDAAESRRRPKVLAASIVAGVVLFAGVLAILAMIQAGRCAEHAALIAAAKAAERATWTVVHDRAARPDERGFDEEAIRLLEKANQWGNEQNRLASDPPLGFDLWRRLNRDDTMTGE